MAETEKQTWVKRDTSRVWGSPFLSSVLEDADAGGLDLSMLGHLLGTIHVLPTQEDVHPQAGPPREQRSISYKASGWRLREVGVGAA